MDHEEEDIAGQGSDDASTTSTLSGAMSAGVEIPQVLLDGGLWDEWKDILNDNLRILQKTQAPITSEGPISRDYGTILSFFLPRLRGITKGVSDRFSFGFQEPYQTAVRDANSLVNGRLDLALLLRPNLDGESMIRVIIEVKNWHTGHNPSQETLRKYERQVRERAQSAELNGLDQVWVLSCVGPNIKPFHWKVGSSGDETGGKYAGTIRPTNSHEVLDAEFVHGGPSFGTYHDMREYKTKVLLQQVLLDAVLGKLQYPELYGRAGQGAFREASPEAKLVSSSSTEGSGSEYIGSPNKPKRKAKSSVKGKQEAVDADDGNGDGVEAAVGGSIDGSEGRGGSTVGVDEARHEDTTGELQEGSTGGKGKGKQRAAFNRGGTPGQSRGRRHGQAGSQGRAGAATISAGASGSSTAGVKRKSEDKEQRPSKKVKASKA